MKPTMIYAIVLLTVIILIASFGLQLSPTTPVAVPEEMLGSVLYVCPTASHLWDSIAAGIRPMMRFIIIGFFAALTILMFVWGWTLYQNLLKDKFQRDSFSKPWGFTKVLFWAFVIIMLIMHTPNHYKTVHLNGDSRNWVLCEADSPDARAVRADAVK